MPTAGTGSKATHDIVLTIGGTDYGFMLARDKNGAKKWKVYDSPTLAPQFLSGDPGYGNYPPEREVVRKQSDWRGGFGHAFYDNKPQYYQLVTGCVDGRWKDKIILGPANTPTTITAGAALTGTGVKYAEVGSNFYYATSSKVYIWDTTNKIWTDMALPATGVTDICSFAGLLYVALGASANYQVTNGQKWYVSTHASSKANFFTVLGTSLFKGKTPNEVKSSTTPHIDITAPVASAVIANGAGVTDGTHSYKVAFYWTTGSFVGPASLTSNVITTGAPNNAVTVTIPVHPTDSTAQRLIYRTVSGDTGNYKLVATVADNTTVTYTDTTADGALGADYAASSTDQWSAAYTVGDTETNIRGMITYRTLVYVGKDEGLWTVSATGTVTALLTEFRASRSALNFSRMCVWQDQLFFNIGTGGLVVFNGTSFNSIGWDLLAPDVGSYAEVGAMAAGHDFLYVFIKPTAGGSCTLCTLREEDVDGTTDWRWHSIAQFTWDTPTCAYISPLYQTGTVLANPKLWLGGSDATVNKPPYVILPLIGGSPESDANYSFPTSIQYFYTPNYDMGFRADRKIFLALDVVWNGQSSGTQTLSLWEDIDNTGTWTSLGTDTATATSKVTTKYFSTTSSHNVGRFVRYRIGLTTSVATKTPVIRAILTRAVLRAQRRKVFDFALQCADNIVMQNGQIDKNPASLLATQLKNADDPTVQTGVVTLYDRDNASHTVVFEAMTEEEIMDEVNKRPVRVFFARAIEVKTA